MPAVIARRAHLITNQLLFDGDMLRRRRKSSFCVVVDGKRATLWGLSLLFKLNTRK